MASYNLSFSTQTLEEAIGVYEETLQSRPSGHDRRAKSLDDFGDALWYFCVQHVTDRARIEQCVASLREALQLRGHGHPLRDRSLHKLARALFAVRYQHLGGRDALEESISLNREALQLRPVGHPDRDKSLNNLAVALTKSFENYGDPRDLIEAIDVQREDLQLCPPGHPDRTISLDSLGNALYVLYQFSSGSETLAESISLLREALDLLPVGHPRRVAALHNLANALMINFSHEGQSDSLQEAVDLNHQALFLMPETYPDRALMMNSAATALLHSFREHGGSAKLAEVIRLYREALKLQPPGHPTRDIALNNLGEGLQVVFDEYQDTGALLEAVALHREVFELRSLSAFERLRATENLAQLHCRPECQSWIQALAWYREALDMCPAGFPSRSRLLSGMSSCFLDPGSPAFEISAAIGCLAEGYADNFTHINQRLRLSVVDLRRVEDAHRATLERSGASSAAQESEQILHLYVQVIELLPRAANFGLDHRSRLQALAGSDEISRNAAARAVLLERVPQAVELLEEGRGIFWSQCLHMRVTGFDGVPYSDRQRLEELFRLLKNGAHRLQSSDHTSAQRERDLEARRQLNVEAEALIAKIRSHPGLDRFLLPATFQTLINSLPDGYVVVVNASRFGHHALLLSRTAGLAQSLVLKPLRTAFDSAALRMHLPRDIKLDAEPKDETSAGTRAMRLVDTGRRSIDHVLSLLWENVAQPIIKKLRLQVNAT
jgi:tetratricopeptide (TPR) repeat protein